MPRRDGFRLHSFNSPSSQEPVPDSWGSAVPAVQPGQLAVDQVARVRKKGRSRSYEKAHQAGQLTLRGVPTELHDQVRAIADELNVRVDHVGRAFLEYGLLAYRNGDFSIQARPKGRKLCLYVRDGWGREASGWQAVSAWRLPAQTTPAAKPSRKKAAAEPAKLWKQVLTLHDIPQELKAQLNDICDSLFVTKGELVTALLAHSALAYQNQILTLTPIPADARRGSGPQ